MTDENKTDATEAEVKATEVKAKASKPKAAKAAKAKATDPVVAMGKASVMASDTTAFTQGPNEAALTTKIMMREGNAEVGYLHYLVRVPHWLWDGAKGNPQKQHQVVAGLLALEKLIGMAEAIKFDSEHGKHPSKVDPASSGAEGEALMRQKEAEEAERRALARHRSIYGSALDDVGGDDYYPPHSGYTSRGYTGGGYTGAERDAQGRYGHGSGYGSSPYSSQPRTYDSRGGYTIGRRNIYDEYGSGRGYAQPYTPAKPKKPALGSFLPTAGDAVKSVSASTTPKTGTNDSNEE